MATITTTTPPSDLTGYTVTFGESPHLTRYGGGTLDLNGVISCQGYSQVFNLDFDGIYNSISPNYAFNYSSPQNSVTQENYVGIYGGVTLIDAMYGSLISITFNGGSDSSNSSFVQWLVDNNATFTKEGEEETPTTSKMKLEVLYKGEVIGSLSEGESITLHLNGQKLTEDLFVRAVGDAVIPEVTKLSAPTITTDGTVVTITDTSGLATEFGFYHNGTPLFYTADTVVNLSEKLLDTFGAGTYNITVTALADGYEESEPSNTVEYVVEESVPTNLTGYTVTVPAGWSASAGYGTFYLEGTFNDALFGTLFIGYNPYTDGSNFVANCIYTNDANGGGVLYPSNSFTMEITGGDDSASTSLIQWLANNNASFEKTVTTPTLISFILRGETYQAEEGMTWQEWVANTTYNTVGAYVGVNPAVIRVPLSGINLCVSNANGGIVAPTDKIIANTAYGLETVGGGSND